MAEPVVDQAPSEAHPEPELFAQDLPLAPALPEEGFDEKYNKRLEAPLAIVTAILVHVLIGALLLYVLTQLIGRSENRDLPPMQLTDIGGLDNFGDGSEGQKGVEDKLADANTPDQIFQEPTPENLPQAVANVQEAIKFTDPNQKLAVSPTNAAAYSQLNEAIRNKLLGNRNSAGDSPGTGPGGTGSSSTLARNLRWTAFFSWVSAQQYLAQLDALGAKVFIPLPKPDDKTIMLFEKPANPGNRRIATDADMGALAGLIRFSTRKAETVIPVGKALNLEFQPESLWAFFPRSFEQELASKEEEFLRKVSTFTGKQYEIGEIEVTKFYVKVTTSGRSVRVTEMLLNDVRRDPSTGRSVAGGGPALVTYAPGGGAAGVSITNQGGPR